MKTKNPPRELVLHAAAKYEKKCSYKIVKISKKHLLISKQKENKHLTYQSRAFHFVKLIFKIPCQKYVENNAELYFFYNDW